MDQAFRKLVNKLYGTIRDLEAWDRDDLVQEAYLRALISLEGYRGGSSLKTYMLANVRNHLISMARHAAYRPRPVGEMISQKKSPERDPHKRLLLRGNTKRLLGWLKQNPSEVESGWEVFNLLLWTHGDYDYVATAMCIHTGSAWTTERVRNVVRKIRNTDHGRSLCDACGLTTDGSK